MIKKIFITGVMFLALSVPTSVVFASPNVSLFMQNFMSFTSNDGTQILPAITITDNSGGNITPDHGITIILPKYMDILWESSVNQLSINGNLKSVSYDKTLKKLIVPVDKTFTAGESITITLQQVRVYEVGSTYQNLALDVIGDGSANVPGANGLQIDDTSRRTDQLNPYPITGLTTAQGSTSITLAWENPADIDFNGVLITRTLTRGSSTDAIDVPLDRLVTTYTDTPLQKGDSVKYVIKSKDNYNNFGTSVSTTVQIPLEGVVVPPPPVIQDQPIVAVSSVLDSVTQADIDEVMAKFIDISVNSKNFKEAVYLVKHGVLKGSFKKLRLSKKITYAEFANLAGRAFSVAKKGTYFASLKNLGYFPGMRSGRLIKRKDVFLALLKLKNISSTNQTIENLEDLSGNTSNTDVVSWIIKLYDTK